MAFRALSFMIFSMLAFLVHSETPLELNCRIEPMVRVDISSSVEGIVSEILVSKNDLVKKGDKLATLKSSLQAATASLKKLQSELSGDIKTQELAYDFSVRNLKRVAGLHAKAGASKAELDKAKTEKQLAELQLQQAKDRQRQAELEYQRALADLELRTITSPIDATVTEIFKDPGEHIYFDPVMQLIQSDPLRVEAFAPANLYGRIEEGTRAVVTPEITLNKRTFDVVVDKVDKAIDAASGTFGVTLLIPNPGQSIPSGLKCNIVFPNVIIRPVSLY